MALPASLRADVPLASAAPDRALLSASLAASNAEPEWERYEADAIDHLKYDRLADAEVAFERALSLRQRFHPSLDDPSLASAVNNLAVVHMKQRRLADAESGFRRALRMKQALHPAQPDHP